MAARSIKSGRGGEGGFTVLEALVALMIAAGAIAATMTLFSDAFFASGQAEARGLAVEAARSTLARIGADIPARPGEHRFDDGPLAVAVALSYYEPEQGGETAPLSAPRLLAVRIEAMHRDGGPPVTVQTMIAEAEQ